MYQCKECGLVFDRPKTWTNTYGYDDGFPIKETFYGCPECEGDFEEYYEEEEDEEDE